MDYIVNGLRGRRLCSMLIWVLDGNPSYQFYEYLGGQKVGQKRVEINRIQADEVSYGWLDAFKILNRNGT